MDEALTQDDGVNLSVEELDRCWEVTQDQDRASKIEKAFFKTQRDVKIATTFMSYVALRKLNFQQLENALGTSLSVVIKGYATLRDAKLAESSYDKVVMWTGGSYDYDDVVRALVRLDRPEMRPGTSGQRGKTVPTYFTDPEVDVATIVPGSESWTQPSTDRPNWTRFSTHCKRTSTSARTERRRSHVFARSPSRAFFYMTDEGQETIEEKEVPQILCRLDQLSDILGTRLSERISMLRRSPEVSSAPDAVQAAEIRDRA